MHARCSALAPTRQQAVNVGPPASGCPVADVARGSRERKDEPSARATSESKRPGTKDPGVRRSQRGQSRTAHLRYLGADFDGAHRPLTFSNA